ncbi:molybdenum cofactor guanylyltransferase [Pseudothermotoga thermarum]|uniref:Molybdopterin-guanine dinucleotide biosynthesis protein MobA n=1 Tax=Pseudothermotoga thermarum DSM 5069 TaxID=688269 RepID=F7YUN2_9THEM|nr:molybdenum cofactor guanylyltransferase [Pseudothermotoga thermarum]AEH50217.1 molybdopterin-guanine dinucleotide biosynthesis protein MobA [Pseudothermotoga thermarum DSM 5069]
MIAVILNGGRSTRFGEDKSNFSIGNLTMVEVVFNKLCEVFEKVILVGKPHPKLPYVVDKYFKGPVGGLLTALELLDEDVFLIGCDMPCVMPEVVKRMLKFFNNDVDAVVPMLSDGFHPLHAIYSKRMEKHLRKSLLEDCSFKTAFKYARVVFLTEEDFKDIKGWQKSFININTKADLKLLEVI